MFFPTLVYSSKDFCYTLCALSDHMSGMHGKGVAHIVYTACIKHNTQLLHGQYSVKYAQRPRTYSVGKRSSHLPPPTHLVWRHRGQTWMAGRRAHWCWPSWRPWPLEQLSWWGCCHDAHQRSWPPWWCAWRLSWESPPTLRIYCTPSTCSTQVVRLVYTYEGCHFTQLQ